MSFLYWIVYVIILLLIIRRVTLLIRSIKNRETSKFVSELIILALIMILGGLLLYYIQRP